MTKNTPHKSQLNRWKKKFYPVPAKEVSQDDALDHSIKKWSGLVQVQEGKWPGLVANHYTRYGASIRDEETFTQFPINGDTCALCHHYLKKDASCSECPLYKSLGNRRCDSYTAPYEDYVFRGDAKPMLAALKEAKKQVLKEKDKNGGN